MHVRRACLLPALIAACCGAAASDLGADLRAGRDDYAPRVLAALNDYRLSRGLPALALSPALVALAAQHSSSMAAFGRPSHDGFAQRFERSGADLCVENVARGFKIPEQVIGGWRGVATHHANMLDAKVRYAGVARSGAFVTFFACG
jgi:uncharacterized protein YkwD